MIKLPGNLKLDYRIRAGYGVAFILLLISYALSWVANNALIKQSKQALHTNQVMQYTEALASYMKDAETSARGYMITRDKISLEPFYKSRANVDSTFNFLKKETKDNTQQQIRLYKLKDFIDRKYDVLEGTLEKLDVQHLTLDSIVKQSRQKGRLIMDSIRYYTDEMKKSEAASLEAKVHRLHSNYVSIKSIYIVSLVLALLFALLGFITFLRENSARKTADGKVNEYQNQLQKRIEELDTANKELIQMRRSEKFAATGRIARSIAHEVRNPLTNIDLAIGQIKAEIKNIDEGDMMLFDMVNRNSKRINQLITELLNATRFAELNYQPADVTILIDEALELANDRIVLKNIRIEKSYGSTGTISADVEKVKIALLNIIVNAVEAMDETAGLLKISTKTEVDKCVVEISDNGPGMDAEALSKLFEPYYTTKSKGNGLGLTNTQNIILNHKGSINVESSKGRGTNFIIKFDLLQQGEVG